MFIVIILCVTVLLEIGDDDAGRGTQMSMMRMEKDVTCEIVQQVEQSMHDKHCFTFLELSEKFLQISRTIHNGINTN